jgi:murein DD-endopeptidase MepM/ murein hydrolase activator NlpD
MRIIYELLVKKGMRNTALLEEYLDHYATEFEDLLSNSNDYDESIKTVTTSIHQLDVKKINRTHFLLHHKNKLMLLSFISVMLAAITFTTSPIISDPPSIAPIVLNAKTIQSGFGQRMHPLKKVLKMHNGIDLRAPLGTKVVAPSAGVIEAAGFDKSYGNYIQIKHDEIYSTRYHHLSKISVEKDQKVNIGDKIGEIGSTGLSTGPHLHYEVLEKGKHIDPAKFLNC